MSPAARAHLVVLLSRGAGAYRTTVRRTLDERGFADVPRSGSWLLTALVRAPRTGGELAVLLGTSKQGLSRLSDALVERGYLRRSQDPTDHRRVRFALTPRGRRAAACVSQAVGQVDRTLERRAGREATERARQALAMLFSSADPAEEAPE
ncbi:MAG TPA: MarR family transcriptional regulator [Candidatus Dormibacteraeota bacterium]